MQDIGRIYSYIYMYTYNTFTLFSIYLFIRQLLEHAQGEHIDAKSGDIKITRTNRVTFDVCGFSCGKIAGIVSCCVQRERRLCRILLQKGKSLLINHNCK